MSQIKILTGIDIVDIGRFEKALKEGGERLLSRMFLPSERSKISGQHLAGIFAAKEAVVKALSITRESWLLIEILNEPSGKPRAVVHADISYDVIGCDISIAHDGGTAIANCVVLVS
ncbi:holo-ACP synthase [Candidatus Kaiserbacteria bacterium]|nr:holo-ACP synthase [Candidatus Kaiserbacteria bacterium]